MAIDGKANDKVTLVAGGDVGPMIEPVDQYADLILPVWRQADLRFGQCERSYSERGYDPQWTGSTPGGHSRLPPRMASIWQTAGIDVISIASNHAMDWGPEALLDTRELFRGMGKHVAGAGKDSEEARRPAIVHCKGVKIAFLAYTSVLRDGQAAGPGKPGMAPMRAHTHYMADDYQPGTPPTIISVPYDKDLIALQEDIKAAKKQADVVVMSIHWGVRFAPKTIATYQPTVAHAAIDAGADLILGHHAHVPKAVEVYKGKVCFYSIGNFLTNSRRHRYFEWNLMWYRVDPECLRDGLYCLPDFCQKTLIAKAVISKNGIERVSFLPAYINSKAQPAVLPPSDPKFQEMLDYMEWVSDEHPHKFSVDGSEILVEAPS
jgi:poly-gamma-glutamate capsule biosynthesis protein CapA/YwtB (metallophosphatase superfamily)